MGGRRLILEVLSADDSYKRGLSRNSEISRLVIWAVVVFLEMLWAHRGQLDMFNYHPIRTEVHFITSDMDGMLLPFGTPAQISGLHTHLPIHSVMVAYHL